MAIVQNTFEGGTSGATITTSNSGGASGPAWDFIEIDPGATATFTTTASNGSRGASFTGNGAHAYLSWYLASTTKLSMRAYVRLPALPSAEFQAITPRFSSNYVSSINFTTAGKIKLTSTSPGTPTLFTSAAALSVNTWYRVEASWQIGTTASNGLVQFKYFLGDSTTVIESFTTAVANLGTLPMVEVRIGKLNATGNTPILMDSVAYDLSTTTLLGPYASVNIPPIANAGTGGSDIEPGTILTLDGSGSSDPDGTISTYTWTQTDGAAATITGSGATRTVKAPYATTGTVLGFKLRVTDNSSGFTEATVVFSILPCTERAVMAGGEVPLEIRLATNP